MSGPEQGPEDLAIERREDVLWLTLDRPRQRNAITAEMLVAMIEALEAARTDDDLRAIAIRATGEHFCGGMDIARTNPGAAPGAAVSAPEPTRRPRITERHRSVDAGPHRLLELMTSVELPVVAEVRGVAAGIGCAIALAADFAVVSERASFLAPYVRRGFTPDSGTTYLLPRLVGIARARRMLLLGEAVDADRAERWGLIDRAWPDHEVDAAFTGLVDELRRGPTVALGMTKWLLAEESLSGFRAAMRRETVVVDLTLRTQDFKEGIRAFLGRRDPEFEGR